MWQAGKKQTIIRDRPWPKFSARPSLQDSAPCFHLWSVTDTLIDNEKRLCSYRSDLECDDKNYQNPTACYVSGSPSLVTALVARYKV